METLVAYKGDEMILEAIKRKFLIVDHKLGKVLAVRFRNKEIGTVNLKGYKVATLHLDGQRKQVKLHRIIWISRNGLIPKDKVIDHINRIKSDNRIINLRLATAKLNSKNRRSYKGENNPAAKINHYIASAIRNEKLSYYKLAEKYEVSKTLIAKIKKGKIWN